MDAFVSRSMTSCLLSNLQKYFLLIMTREHGLFINLFEIATIFSEILLFCLIEQFNQFIENISLKMKLQKENRYRISE